MLFKNQLNRSKAMCSFKKERDVTCVIYIWFVQATSAWEVHQAKLWMHYIYVCEGF